MRGCALIGSPGAGRRGWLQPGTGTLPGARRTCRWPWQNRGNERQGFVCTLRVEPSFNGRDLQTQIIQCERGVLDLIERRHLICILRIFGVFDRFVKKAFPILRGALHLPGSAACSGRPAGVFARMPRCQRPAVETATAATANSACSTKNRETLPPTSSISYPYRSYHLPLRPAWRRRIHPDLSTASGRFAILGLCVNISLHIRSLPQVGCLLPSIGRADILGPPPLFEVRSSLNKDVLQSSEHRATLGLACVRRRTVTEPPNHPFSSPPAESTDQPPRKSPFVGF